MLASRRDHQCCVCSEAWVGAKIKIKINGVDFTFGKIIQVDFQDIYEILDTKIE